MKTIDEKLFKAACVISAVSLCIALICAIAYCLFEKELIGTIGTYGLTFLMTPVLLMQIFMFGNIGEFGLKSMGKTSLLFILLIFPICDIWFITGLDSIFHYTPNFRLFPREIAGEIRIIARQQMLFFASMLYLSLILAGFTTRLRLLKSRN